MKPSDLSLPPKFEHYWPGQNDVIANVAASDKRFTLLSMPTGSGKSLIYMSIAKLLNARTLVLTGTKGLQQQLMTDFEAVGLYDVRGQGNYDCIAVHPGQELEKYGPSVRVDKGPCHIGVECSLKERSCTYYSSVREARRSKFVITNFAYWMTNARYSEPDVLGKFDLLIIDEAHTIPDALAHFCAVTLDRAEVRSLLNMALPPIDDAQDTWVDWAKMALMECRRRITDQVRQIHGLRGKEWRQANDRLFQLNNLIRGLEQLSMAHDWLRSHPSSPDVWMPGAGTDWVAESTASGIQFSPVWAHAYAEQYLFRDTPRVVLTSATLQPSVQRYLGIDPSKSEFREFQSRFDPKRRPLIWVPTAKVDRNMLEGDTRVWVNRMDAIIAKRLDRKGIIHTRSYDRMNQIVQRSRFKHMMIVHGSGQYAKFSARDAITQYKESKVPCILVSPSLQEGYDFPGSECRYQIIAKVPFVDTRSKVLQARSKSDKGYFMYLTALALIQQAGRGMRSASDWCETFIVDDNISWAWPAMRNMLPRWFKAAYRKHIGIPEAMKP